MHYQLNKIDNLLNFDFSEKKKIGIPKSKPVYFCKLCGKVYNKKNWTKTTHTDSYRRKAIPL